MTGPLAAVTFDLDQAASLPAKLRRAYLRAGKRALVRAAAYGRTRVIRAIASSTGAKVSLLRNSRRVQSALRAQGSSLVLWAGIKPATSALFGTAVQTPTGARVAGDTYAGSFVRAIKRTSNRGGIRISRTGPAIIWERDRGAGARVEARPRSINKWGRTTLPISPLPFPLDQAREPILALRPQITTQLQIEVQRQLEYALNVERSA